MAKDLSMGAPGGLYIFEVQASLIKAFRLYG